MTNGNLDLVRELLDHELVDVDGVPCGMVDDVELSGAAGERCTVAALWVGPGAWGPRLPALLAAATAWWAGTRRVRVPWKEITRVDERVELRSSATALGLGIADRRYGRWLRWVPGHDQAD
jgi:sporulation protein YlmC with PRC-barrel domain